MTATYVTFRDMGAAFGVALLGIYILVVAQFGSFRLPLVILTPIPLTFLGIMVGHWIFSAPFSATSMIGFIAPASIVIPIDFARLPVIAVVGALAYGETLDPFVFLGAAVIFAGNWINLTRRTA
jgi:Cu/Ag efflux pump CusA